MFGQDIFLCETLESCEIIDVNPLKVDIWIVINHLGKKYFNKVIISSDNYWIYGDRAIAKMCIGDYKGAIEDFDKALKLENKEVYKEKRQECLNILKTK